MVYIFYYVYNSNIGTTRDIVKCGGSIKTAEPNTIMESGSRETN